MTTPLSSAQFGEGEWSPDPHNAFNPKTYEWFEKQDADSQDHFLGKIPSQYSDDFQREQYNHVNHRSAKRSRTNVREEWDTHLENERTNLENATNGVTLSKSARAAGRTTRDLYQVNAKTARSWASEETRRYWDEHGRASYGAFKGEKKARESANKEYWG